MKTKRLHILLVMFIPIGGIFMFGNNGTRGGAVFNFIMSLVNLAFAATALVIGYTRGLYPLVVIGYILLGLGGLMLVSSIVSLFMTKKTVSYESETEPDYSEAE